MADPVTTPVHVPSLVESYEKLFDAAKKAVGLGDSTTPPPADSHTGQIPVGPGSENEAYASFDADGDGYLNATEQQAARAAAAGGGRRGGSGRATPAAEAPKAGEAEPAVDEKELFTPLTTAEATAKTDLFTGDHDIRHLDPLIADNYDNNPQALVNVLRPAALKEAAEDERDKNLAALPTVKDLAAARVASHEDKGTSATNVMQRDAKSGEITAVAGATRGPAESDIFGLLMGKDPELLGGKPVIFPIPLGTDDGGRSDHVDNKSFQNLPVAQQEVIFKYLEGLGDPLVQAKTLSQWAADPHAIPKNLLSPEDYLKTHLAEGDEREDAIKEYMEKYKDDISSGNKIEERWNVVTGTTNASDLSAWLGGDGGDGIDGLTKNIANTDKAKAVRAAAKAPETITDELLRLAIADPKVAEVIAMTQILAELPKQQADLETRKAEIDVRLALESTVGGTYKEAEVGLATAQQAAVDTKKATEPAIKAVLLVAGKKGEDNQAQFNALIMAARSADIAEKQTAAFAEIDKFKEKLPRADQAKIDPAIEAVKAELAAQQALQDAQKTFATAEQDARNKIRDARPAAVDYSTGRAREIQELRDELIKLETEEKRTGKKSTDSSWARQPGEVDNDYIKRLEAERDALDNDIKNCKNLFEGVQAKYDSADYTDARTKCGVEEGRLITARALVGDLNAKAESSNLKDVARDTNALNLLVANDPTKTEEERKAAVAAAKAAAIDLQPEDLTDKGRKELGEDNDARNTLAKNNITHLSELAGALNTVVLKPASEALTAIAAGKKGITDLFATPIADQMLKDLQQAMREGRKGILDGSTAEKRRTARDAAFEKIMTRIKDSAKVEETALAKMLGLDKLGERTKENRSFEEFGIGVKAQDAQAKGQADLTAETLRRKRLTRPSRWA